MSTFLFRWLRGVSGLLFYLIVSILIALGIIVAGACAWLFGWLGLKKPFTRLAYALPTLWARLLSYHMSWGNKNKWIIQGNATLSADQWYLLIANHTSWIDIPIILKAFHEHTPILKFFMKKSLLWLLPFAGIACWVLDYPFMRRHTPSQIKRNPALKGQDIKIAKQACVKFKMHPTTIINFVEGTRVTPEKKQRQNSPYQHLLKPKAGGMGVVIYELKDYLAGILNVTIHYAEPQLTFWQFLCGDYAKITVHFELIPITDNLIGNYYEDRVFRQNLQNWLNDIWAKKDKILGFDENTH